MFGPEYTGSVTTGVDWSYADLSYTDITGFTVNTASFGASQWLYTNTRYDDQGNVVFALDTGATSRILTAIAAGGSPGSIESYGNTTLYNPVDTGTTPAAGLPALTTAKSIVTDTYGPARTATLPDGTTSIIRPHTHTDYDQGAPSATNPATTIGWALPTTVTVTADASTTSTPGIGVGPVISRNFTGYNDAAGSGTGPTSGWTLGVPTTQTTDMDLDGTKNVGDITTTTYYNAEGRTVETRQPSSAGADAGTTLTSYYSSAAQTGADAICGSKGQWAGLPCRTVKAGQPAGPTLPNTTTTGYSYLLAPTTIFQTSGASSRTTTTTYLPDGRADTSTLIASGSGASTATSRPATQYVYDAATGAQTGTSTIDGSATTSTVLDSWGRTTSYTSAQGDTTTTTYDAAGRVAAVTDPKGTTTYTYDSAGSERRGLPTKVSISRTGGAVEFTGSYNPDGALTRQVMPGGLSEDITYDEAGQQVGLTYTGQVTPVTESTDPVTGQTTWTPGTPAPGPWLSWSHDRDARGLIVADYTTGAAIDGTPGVTDPTSPGAPSIGQALGSNRAYTYDQAGRLTQVADRTATATGETVAPGTPADPAIPCTVRAYAFDANGSRTQLATTGHSDGGCFAAATSTTTATYNYDTADRPTAGATTDGTPGAAYSYDELGRQTTLPAVDAPTPAKGDITLGYYDNDLPRTVTQDGAVTTYGLDLTDRRTTATTQPVTGPPTTSTTVRHYADSSDNPAWTDNTTGTGTVTTRYAEALTGDLGVTIATDGTCNLSLANTHGDVVTTATIPAGQAPTINITTIDGWSDSTEYGTPTNAAATATVAGPIGYGWLGAKQRSTTTESAGLTLMGARLYNPTRGNFTSLDPEPGGNTTAYTYPQDPINGYDLNGKWGWGWLGTAAKVAGVVAFGACVLASAGVCLAAGAIAAGVSIANNAHRKATDRSYSWRSFAIDTGIDLVSARFSAVRGLGNYVGRARTIAKWSHNTGIIRGKSISYPTVRAAFRAQPVRSAFRVGVQSYYLHRSLSGRNRVLWD